MTTADPAVFDELVAPLRPGLLLHCYRMLASSHDAEDAVQETLVRAWRSLDRFEGRSALSTWLYTIATNVCLREIERRGRRLRPVDLSPSADPAIELGAPLTETVWLGPLPAAGLMWASTPAEAVYEQKEAVELAFVAALQHLLPLQRAVLVMRDVLAMPAAEVAEALDTTVAAVNSALQRARAALHERLPDRSQQRVLRDVGDDRVRETVTAFVAAWERSDIDAVVALLAEDVVLTMPPYLEWYAGRGPVETFLASAPLAPGKRWSCTPTTANGQPAIAKHRWDAEVGAWLAHSLSVLSLDDRGAVLRIDAFLDPSACVDAPPRLGGR
ncbi:RNA polymerase subunit sigma-70 [Nocardioides sp. CGMCC 1.13656]|uniref:RNA polymerase subunit sigma-70 n=1 Tax=Nocardioides TaxID=1839 RepID=UPI0012FA2ACE|nr:RNA polymerase subunit sigma-70 [Nocardioides sp. CGMCC 1.13656]MBA2952573.1 RNA polymerase subunit sigma-70 [Nocardioides sp. CGMCC 1.13656]